jgi:hypothetical protein
MTVKELTDLLKNKRQDMRVVVRGYEAGVNDITCADEIPVRIDANREWCYGAHEKCAEELKDETVLHLMA